ncbi:MAG: hypothetical protein IKX00_01940 [Bacilli bacterium]|nr:hypothetical protein [Bacilli bacterium]
MSLKVEHYNLEEFEKTINDPETTKKISEAFAKADEQIKKDLSSIPKTSDDIIKDVVKKIRKAKTLDEAKEVLLDNIVALYETEEIAYLIQHSLIEGSNNIDAEDISKQEPETVFGVTREQFDQMYNENNGFNVTYPKDNLPRVSDDFNSFMVKASQGYSETIANQKEDVATRSRGKDPKRRN